MIRFNCPQCSAQYQVRDEYGGRSAKCKHCGGLMHIPEPVVEAVAAVTADVGQVHDVPPVPRVPQAFAPAAQSDPPVAWASIGQPAYAAEPVVQAGLSGGWPAVDGRPMASKPRMVMMLGIIGGAVVLAATVAVVLWLTLGRGHSSTSSGSGGGGSAGTRSGITINDGPVVVRPVVDREIQAMVNQAARGGEKLTLKIKFTPGKYRLDEKMGMGIRMRLDGQSVPIDMEMNSGAEVVFSPPDSSGDQTLRMTIKDMSMRAGGMEYDSRRGVGAGSEIGKALAPIIGSDVTFHGRDGKFTDVSEGVDTLMGKMSQAGSVDRKTADQLSKMMKPFIKEMLTQHWGELIPDVPVGVGDGWTRTMHIENMPALGPIDLEAECAVVDIEDSPGGKYAVLALAVKTAIRDREMDMSAMGDAPSGVRATIKSMDIQMTGKAKFDTAIGLTTRGNIDEKLTGEMSMSMGDERKTMNMDVTVKYTNTLNKAD